MQILLLVGPAIFSARQTTSYVMYATKNPLSLSWIESVRGLLRFMLLKPWQTNINDQLCFAGMGDLGGIERVGASQLCLLR